MDTITNTGELYTDSSASTLFDSASVTFNVANASILTMTKTVDRPNEFYLPGDSITFTITITNTGDSAINGLLFRDTIDPAVAPVNGNDFTVTTTAGTITSDDSTVEISDIDIGPGGTVVITITGRIA